MGDYWKKGDKDPEAGAPFRHARQKARLLLDDATPDQMRETLAVLISSRPNDVLDALCAVLGD